MWSNVSSCPEPLRRSVRCALASPDGSTSSAAWAMSSCTHGSPGSVQTLYASADPVKHSVTAAAAAVRDSTACREARASIRDPIRGLLPAGPCANVSNGTCAMGKLCARGDERSAVRSAPWSADVLVGAGRQQVAPLFLCQSATRDLTREAPLGAQVRRPLGGLAELVDQEAATGLEGHDRRDPLLDRERAADALAGREVPERRRLVARADGEQAVAGREGQRRDGADRGLQRSAGPRAAA